MLHRRPGGSEATQGLPFISARVPQIGPDTNSVTAELHFQVEKKNPGEGTGGGGFTGSASRARQSSVRSAPA